MKPRRARSLLAIYQAPAIIFFLTLLGLITSLLTAGLIGLLGVVATASSLVAIVWALLKSNHDKKRLVLNSTKEV